MKVWVGEGKLCHFDEEEREGAVKEKKCSIKHIRPNHTLCFLIYQYYSITMVKSVAECYSLSP